MNLFNEFVKHPCKKYAYHEHFMKKALRCAKIAEKAGDVPVGCLIVKEGKIISVGLNMREMHNDVTEHAEMVALRRACDKLGDWRLTGCDMYVTLEPCPMCAGAILQSRIGRLFIGAVDLNLGAAGSKIDLFNHNLFNHNIEVNLGVLLEECSSQIKDFFKAKR